VKKSNFKESKMAQYQKKIAQNKTQTSAANSNKNLNATQLKDNRELNQLQKKLHGKSIDKESTLNPIQRKTNTTGLPNNLKSGIENLSGQSMDDVKVYFNSTQPAQLNAHAYAQGTDIHVASGQEKHLPHEAWHVVQQKQGRVKPTLQMKGKVYVNNDKGLENEADVMGAKALLIKPIKEQKKSKGNSVYQKQNINSKESPTTDNLIQCVFNPTALQNFDAAQKILTNAENNYIEMDHELDGNRQNWGFSNPTWDTLRNNITIKSNHIRGQGVADALESLSWKVNNHPKSVRGPGGGAGIDLRLFTSGGIGASRMDFEIKHANTIASLRDQINAAVVAHGRNQTIKIYKNPTVPIPNIDDVFVRAHLNYTFRVLGYAGDEDSARVEFFNDTSPRILEGTRVISWH
jgi:hypothetical protein